MADHRPNDYRDRDNVYRSRSLDCSLEPGVIVSAETEGRQAKGGTVECAGPVRAARGRGVAAPSHTLRAHRRTLQI